MTFIQENMLYFISYMDVFAVSLCIPLFNQHLQSLGFSNIRIGLLSSIYSGVQFISSPVLGHLSDVHGTKFALITSIIICALCYPLMGFAASFVSMIAIRAVIGFMKHTQLMCKNYIQETTTEHLQVKKFGRLNGFTSMGYILGPILGGYIIDLENGFTYMCCLTGSFFLINSSMAYSLPSPTRKRQLSKTVHRNFISSFRNIPWTVCWDLFVLKCLSVSAVFSFYMNYSQAVSARYGASTVLIGYSLSVQGCVRATTAFFIHYLLQLFPEHVSILTQMQICYGIVILSFVAMYFAYNFYLFLLLLVPLNVCLCYIRIINHEALVSRIKEYNMGIILGAYNNVTAICRFVLPLVSGFAIDVFGYDSVYLLPIIALCVGIFTISSRGNIQKKIE